MCSSDLIHTAEKLSAFQLFFCTISRHVHFLHVFISPKYHKRGLYCVCKLKAAGRRQQQKNRKVRDIMKTYKYFALICAAVVAAASTGCSSNSGTSSDTGSSVVSSADTSHQTSEAGTSPSSVLEQGQAK